MSGGSRIEKRRCIQTGLWAGLALCCALWSQVAQAQVGARQPIGNFPPPAAPRAAIPQAPPTTSTGLQEGFLPPRRLPPLPQTEGSLFGPPADRLAMVPPSGDNSSYLEDPRDPDLPYDLLDPDEQNALLKPKRPPMAKDGILQWTTFRKTFLATGNRATGMGMTDLTWQTIFAFPFFTREKPLLITPYFGVHWLTGPVPVDLPPRLYDVSLEFRILRQVTPKLGVDFAVAPSIYNDFENFSRKAYRVTGRGVGLYTFNDRWQLAGGVAYLGWASLPVLPVGGLIWTPNEDWRVEAIVPRPRVLQRFFDGVYGDWWCYVAGEVGGNSYAIKRATGVDDVATYRDYRVELGLERRGDTGTYHRFEVGYVFGRSVTYESNTPSFDPSSTVMLRGEAVF
jgi:hypothetical protein